MSSANPASPRTPPPTEPATAMRDPDVSCLAEGREFIKHLTISDKNFQLYPQFGRVVQGSLQALEEAAQTLLDAAGPIYLDVSQTQLCHEGNVLYEEPAKSSSLAFRLYKDGVRQLIFQPGVKREELTDFLECLRDARKVDEDEEDFTTLFWEKDCNHVQVQVVDDIVLPEELPAVPARGAGLERMNFDRFRAPEAEEEQLREALEKKKAEEGDSTFEITAEEADKIREMARNEESYFALCDFVDIVLELMVRNPDPAAFSRSVKMIRTVIASLVQDLDFAHAAFLMTKFSGQAHPGLTEAHQTQLQEMVASFTDKQTLHVLKIFLQEHDRLPRDHTVFQFMKAFSVQAIEPFCDFLFIRQHVLAVTEVLTHLGVDSPETFSKYLDHSDEDIVRAAIDIIFKVDESSAVSRIATVLKHPAEPARVYAAKKMLEHGDASIGRHFVYLLREDSRQLLNLALQFFAKTPYPQAYESLEALCKSRNFYNLDAKRQTLCFKALLKVSTAKALAFIENSVLRHAFSLSKSSEQVKCSALSALAYGPPAESRRLLEKFASKKKGRLASTAARALKDLELAQRSQKKSTAKGISPEVDRAKHG